MAYDLGIVVPIYRSKKSVKRLIDQLEQVFLPEIKIRICLVDDSDDGETEEYLRENCLRPEVTLVVLDGNYGQQAAILCGLRHLEPCKAYGTIDDDLEQPPKMMKILYDRVVKGCDLACGIPEEDSGRPLYRRLGSRMRDRMFSAVLGAPKGMRVSSLRVMKAQVVEDALALETAGFFYLSAAALKGAAEKGKCLKVENLYYTQGRRLQGRSGYGIWKLLRLYGAVIRCYGPGLGGRARNRPLYNVRAVRRSERLLLLGGSNCQIHGAKRAKDMGVDTVLADYTENPPAAGLCGIHERISTFDVEACTRAARRYGVTGVMTMGTDQPVYTAACISSRLGLPGFLTVEQAFSVTNKKKMKEILAAAGIPAAKYRLADRSTRAGALRHMKPPLVIKPLDSQGQRGIYKLQTPEEALDHLESTLSFSRCSEALVEEFYDSDEVTVSGWIKEGRLFILTVTDRLLYPHKTHIGVCTGHRFPSVHMGMYEEIEAVSRRAAEAFGLENGPFYLQLLIGEEGIKVNELAARIGGAFEDRFIPWISGFDILGAVMDSALGRQVFVDCLKGYRACCSERCAAVQLLFCNPGKIGSVTPLEDIASLPYVMDAAYNYGPGQEIPSVENATARFGHAVIWGTRENIGERVDDFYRRLSVRSERGEEMLRRFYP